MHVPAPAIHDRALRIVLAHPFFRRALFSLLISGLGVSMAVPQLTLFMVNELGAPLPVAGLYFLTTLTAPLLGYLIGRQSDARADRLSLFRLCAVAAGLGWTLMALATEVWMPFVIGAVFIAVGGAASAQIFAAVRDELDRHGFSANHRIVATIRLGFTLGWIVGPVLGSVLGAVVPLRAVLGLTAACAFGQVLPLLRMRVQRLERRPAGEPGAPLRLPLGWPLLVFAAATPLALSGDTVKFAYLPLYMQNVLHVPKPIQGLVIGIQPLVELLLMPLFALLADRVGAGLVLVLGVVCGIGASIGYAVSTSVTGLLVSQLLQAGLLAAFAGLGISAAQRLQPHRVGVASSVFFGAMVLNAAVGGVVGSLAVTHLGVPGIFWVPAGLAVLALVGMAAVSRRLGSDRGGLPVTAEPVRDGYAASTAR